MRARTGGRPVAIVPEPARLLWADEFDGPAGSAPSANWTPQVGRFGGVNGELQNYTASAANMQLDGASSLAIIARNEDPPDHLASPKDFTSARLISKGKLQVAPAVGAPVRLAARIKMPWTKGAFPAFWTVGAPDDWPHAGEIDIIEAPALSGRNAMLMNLHGFQVGTGSPGTHKQGGPSAFYSAADFAPGFRVYGVDWYVDRIVWHLDGNVVGAFTQAQWEALGADWTSFSGAWEHYIFLNLAVGSDWTAVGVPDGTSVWPQTMLVDWVRAWAL